MSERKKPVFGSISLALMVGLILVGVLITIYGPPPTPLGENDSLAVVIENAANIIATLLVIATVSLTSIILVGVSFLRHETRWPAVVALCLSASSLTIVIIAVVNL